MDEPTSALDRDAAARIERLVTSLNETGLTVVLVTHNLDQALRLAHHSVLLVEGQVVAAGTPRDVTGSWPKERSS
jgi:ABC-type cobalamin/Fe3+-siderophores transport system ATPase subunit